MTTKPPFLEDASLEGITRAFENLHGRMQTLEANAGASGGDQYARVLKHIYDWAQHFGMKPLPSTEEKPAPVVVPPLIQPEGFDPFRRA